MTALAVVAVGAVVGWARLSARADAARAAAAEEESSDGGPPETLAGGMAPADVPAAVAAAFDQPVIGAAVLEALPLDVQGSCGDEMTWDAEPSQRVVVTPDTMVIVLEGSGAFAGEMGPVPGDGERMQVVCTATAEGDGWVSEGSSFGPMSPDEGASCRHRPTARVAPTRSRASRFRRAPRGRCSRAAATTSPTRSTGSRPCR